MRAWCFAATHIEVSRVGWFYPSRRTSARVEGLTRSGSAWQAQRRGLERPVTERTLLLEAGGMANLSTGGVSLGLLLLRVPLGVVFLAHGLRKVVGEDAVGLQGFADYLGNLGVPLPLPAAVAALAAEILGGVILIVGLGALSRIAALVLTFVMLVALFKAHLHNGFFIPLHVTEPGPVPWGCEFNLVLIGMCLCVFFAGPGEFGLLNGKGKGKGGG